MLSRFHSARSNRPWSHSCRSIAAVRPCSSEFFPARRDGAWHPQIEKPGRNAGGLERCVKILQRQSERLCKRRLLDFRRLEFRSCLRHRHSLWPAVLKTYLDRKNARAGLLKHMHAAFVRGDHPQFGQQKPCTDHWMSGELQLFLRGENTQARQCTIVSRLLYEDRFCKIHLASDRLHRILRKSISIGEDRKRIAFEARIGENIESIKTVTHGVAAQNWVTASPVLRASFHF